MATLNESSEFLKISALPVCTPVRLLENKLVFELVQAWLVFATAITLISDGAKTTAGF